MNTSKEYHRAWRAANPDKVAEYNRRFKAKHPGYKRQWRKTNPDYDREYRETHPGYYAEVTRRYKLAHPGEHYERIKTYRKANPEKRKANDRVYQALKNGKLKRLPCEACGEPKTHAHHSDYTQPLKVKWLCALCHRKAHQQL